MQGYAIKPVERDTFREFASRHAISEEIGRIGTYLDPDNDGPAADHVQTLGLYGCERLCAVACCTLWHHGGEDAFVVKLDSVIVEHDLRGRGLAGLVIGRAFLDLMADERFDITRFYSHAVHPATARLIQQLMFSAPPPIGAPICELSIAADSRADFIAACRTKSSEIAELLEAQCRRCRAGHPLADRWCQPARQAAAPTAPPTIARPRYRQSRPPADPQK